MTRLALALLVGLLAALVPLIATSGQCAQTTSSDVPHILLLVSDESAHIIRCNAGSDIALERVRSVDVVSARISDETIAGVIVDQTTNATLPDDAVTNWAAVGSGRAVFGLDLSRSVAYSRPGGLGRPPIARFEIPPDQSWRPGL